MHLGQAIFHFEGVESISDAERLRGLEVQIPLAERAPPGDGRHYITDLIGCAVWEAGRRGSARARCTTCSAAARPCGAVAESWFSSSHPAGELLIPLAAEICTQIDTAARRIEVRLPDGLRELNAP